MYKNKKILGVITARGGSKGIPQKNIKNLADKPLIAYTINASLKSSLLTRFIVSTENLEIAQVAQEYGAEVPFLRPVDLSKDNSASIDVIKHALKWLEVNENSNYDYVMILQPTSPFRTDRDIDLCIKKIVDTNADSVVSLVELDNFSLEKLKKIDEDLIIPLTKNEGKVPQPRQNLDHVYKRNGAIFLTRTELVLKDDLFGKISRPYIMPEERSIDINREIDLKYAEYYLKNCSIYQ